MDLDPMSGQGGAESRAGVSAFMGVDVQASRACPFAVLNKGGRQYGHGWLKGPAESRCEQLLQAVARIENEMGPVAIGIDAPRQPLRSPRKHFWNGRGGWRGRRAGEKGHGRHCEVVISALGLAKPQWTPPRKDCRPWMRIGFALYECLFGREHVYEVFPRASYNLMNDVSPADARFEISLPGWATGPADMLDACVAAFTVARFVSGGGCEVGGGDGLGSIILPRPVDYGVHGLVSHWPG
jgi:hypothetical protein